MKIMIIGSRQSRKNSHVASVGPWGVSGMAYANDYTSVNRMNS